MRVGGCCNHLILWSNNFQYRVLYAYVQVNVVSAETFASIREAASGGSGGGAGPIGDEFTMITNGHYSPITPTGSASSTTAAVATTTSISVAHSSGIHSPIPFYYPNALPPHPPSLLLSGSGWIPPAPLAVNPYCMIDPLADPIAVSTYNTAVISNQAEQQLEAENAVAALVAEVSRAAASSQQQQQQGDGAEKHGLRKQTSARRRMTGFYPAKLRSTGHPQRDELDVGFAFDIDARAPTHSRDDPEKSTVVANGTAATTTSENNDLTTRYRASRTVVSMAR